MPTIDVTEDTFEAVALQPGTVFVDAWASWCAPCRAFKPIFEATAEKYPDITFAKLNTEENPGLSAALQIRSIPTILAFRDGILLFEGAGAMPQAQFEELIAQVQGLDMDKVREDVAAQKQAEESKDQAE